ncbi:hypothetical protein PG996_012840 [Apiospora saccharicola]|uniref:Rhodopsin domain-containing protein n=1 Tax=Apiospora saccharicola TaxID=335842 RepID=A0ABR1U6I4_9PEZI
MSYGGDFDRGPFLDTINWVFTAISLMIVVARFTSRGLLEKKPWKLDDLFMALAMALVLARTIYITYLIDLGFGHHLEYLLEEDPVKTARLARLAYILLAISLWTWALPKCAVAILLVRLFGTLNRRLAYFMYIPVAILVIWVTILTVITFVQCTPTAKNWTPMLPGECWNPHIYLNMGYFGGALSAALDFGFALFPVLQISSLQMERSRKVLVTISLSLGIPAGIVTIYKLTTLATLINEHDPTWATVPLETWNSVESCALLIAASAPLTKPLMVLIASQIRDLSSRFSGSSGFKSRGSMGLGSGNSAKQPSRGPVATASSEGRQRASGEMILLEGMDHNKSMTSRDTR